MLYSKPDIKYTDMAMFIDEHAYSDNTDEVEGTIFEYIYHISNMLAHKGRFFEKNKYYEEFSLYMAIRVYMRLKNPKQFNGNMVPIKSILNYIKKTIGFAKIDFQNEYFSQVVASTNIEKDTSFDGYILNDKIYDTIDRNNFIEIECCLGDIIKIIKSCLKKIPYKQDTAIWYNIYLSCLLTFLNSITLSNKDIERINNLTSLNYKDNLIEELYYNGKYENAILFHLDPDMEPYIIVLTREIKHQIASDISYSTSYNISSNDVYNDLIYSEIFKKEG